MWHLTRQQLRIGGILLGLPVLILALLLGVGPYYRDLVFVEEAPARYLIYAAIGWQLLGSLLFAFGGNYINTVTSTDSYESYRRPMLTTILVILMISLVTLPVLITILFGPYAVFWLIWCCQ